MYIRWSGAIDTCIDDSGQRHYILYNICIMIVGYNVIAIQVK